MFNSDTPSINPYSSNLKQESLLQSFIAGVGMLVVLAGLIIFLGD